MAEKELRGWIERLESADYLQGKGFLCQEDEAGNLGWCCIGVLNHYAVTEGVIPRPHRCDDGVLQFGASTTHAEGIVLHWVGITEDVETHLINLNDGGTPFVDIAKYLRRLYGLGE